MTENIEHETRIGATKDAGIALPGASLAAGLAALAGASCCALPLVLAILGIGGAWMANLAVLVAWRPWILAAAVVIIAAGWTIAIARGARPRAIALLGLATLALGGAFAVTAWEAEITRALARVWTAA